LWHFSASRHALISIGLMTLRNAFDSCVKSWQYFRTHCIPLNSVSNSLSYDVVRFKIDKTNATRHYATGDARRPCFSIDLQFTVTMLVLCVLGNLLLVLSAEERRTFLKLLWGLVKLHRNIRPWPALRDYFIFISNSGLFSVDRTFVSPHNVHAWLKMFPSVNFFLCDLGCWWPVYILTPTR